MTMMIVMNMVSMGLVDVARDADSGDDDDDDDDDEILIVMVMMMESTP